jgi:hypothetical protein
MDVLGTQMLAKGLDFDNVSLVGIMMPICCTIQILGHLKEVFK